MIPALEAHHTNRPYVFNPTTNNVVDFLRPNESEVEALVRLVQYGLNLLVLALDKVWQRHENAAKRPSMEITEDGFNEMLNVLPPVAWRSTNDGESFKISKRTTGAVTAIFVRLNGRFFEFQDDIRMPHRESCRRVVESEAYRTPSAT